MNFHEVSDNLLAGQTVRSESFGKVKKYLKVVNGGVYVVNHLGNIEPWNATFDILKKDWYVCDDNLNKIANTDDNPDDNPEGKQDIESIKKELNKLKLPELTVKATDYGITIEAGADKKAIIEAIIAKIGVGDNAEE